MPKSNVLILAVSLLGLLSTGLAQAEARRDGGGDQAQRKLQYQLRQLSQENNQLQAQLTELQASNAELEQELEELRSDKQAAESRLDKSRSNNEKLVERIRSDVERYKELLAKYREAVTTLRQANSDNQHLVRAVQEREAWIEECRNNNDELYTANADLLKRYRDLAIKHSEPFTGINKVEVENEYQEYRFRLEDLQVTRFKSSVDVSRHRRDDSSQVASREENSPADN